MYRNDCRLTCWNQNFGIPIRFWTPACQINDDRQIAAKSRQILEVTEPIFTKISYYVVVLV